MSDLQKPHHISLPWLCENGLAEGLTLRHWSNASSRCVGADIAGAAVNDNGLLFAHLGMVEKHLPWSPRQQGAPPPVHAKAPRAFSRSSAPWRRRILRIRVARSSTISMLHAPAKPLPVM